MYSTKVHLVLIICLAVVISLHLFLSSGVPTTFDGHIHLTTAALYAKSLSSFELPNWFQNYAKHGFPLPLIAHQVPAYLHAVLLMVGIPITRLLGVSVLLSSVISGLGLYYFLRNLLHKNDSIAALMGSCLWLASSYRITNIYSRGALPELWAMAVLPWILFIQRRFIVYPTKKSWLLLAILTCMLALSHPILLMIMLFPIAIDGVVLLKKSRLTLGKHALSAIVIGIMLAGYYLIPLVIEMKYFYQSDVSSIVGTEQFLGIPNALSIYWPYFAPNDHPGPRLGSMQFGLAEIIVFAVSFVYLITAILTKRNRKEHNLAHFDYSFASWIVITTLSFIFLNKLTGPFLLNNTPLSLIQFPWRFLSLFHLSTSILFAHILINFKKTGALLTFIVLAMISIRLTEAYGKNYVHHDLDWYSNPQENLHSQNFNPRWVGNITDYQSKKNWLEVIEGTAEIQVIKELQSYRKYIITNKEAVRLSLNTFYFPGWSVEINRSPITIEYQDPNYRGIMTIVIPPGKSELVAVYKDTKIRKFGKLMSVFGIAMLVIGTRFKPKEKLV